MDTSTVLADAFDRVRDAVHQAVDGLSADDLAQRPGGQANSIAWLVWHLTRVQDDHLAEAAGRPQVWASDGWADRFGLPFDVAATGYGHTSAEVAAVAADAEALLGYHDAVHARTLELLQPVTGDDLDRVVDESYDPPVTLGVRLVSVISDTLQHAGQAAYARGLLAARG